MRIGELASRGGVSTKTIRYYESIDLLPEPARTPSGYRDYDERMVERLLFIRDAQASGLTLSEVASVLELKGAGERSCRHTMTLIDAHLEAIGEQMSRLEAARDQLSALAERARGLDPANCTDPDRCQVIAERNRS